LQDPHVDLEAIVEALGEGAKRGFSVIDRNDGYSKLIGPFSSVCLMDEGGHAYETSTVNVHYYRFWSFFFAFEQFGN